MFRKCESNQALTVNELKKILLTCAPQAGLP